MVKENYNWKDEQIYIVIIIKSNIEYYYNIKYFILHMTKKILFIDLMIYLKNVNIKLKINLVVNRIKTLWYICIIS